MVETHRGLVNEHASVYTRCTSVTLTCTDYKFYLDEIFTVKCYERLPVLDAFAEL